MILSLNLHFVSEVEETVEHAPGAWSLGSWWFHLPDSEGWGVDLYVFCFCPATTAAFPAEWSWVWVPECWVSGEVSGEVGSAMRVCTCLASIPRLEELFCIKEQIQTTMTSQDRDS